MTILSTFLMKRGKGKPYMTAAEAAFFKQLRASGAVSFFRTGVCASKDCQAEVPQNKQYCSKECHEGEHVSISSDEG